jgi:hypothetical protein
LYLHLLTVWMNFDSEHSLTIMRVKLESFYWKFWGLPFTLNPKFMLKWVFLSSYSEVKFTEFLQECQLNSRGFQKWLLLAIIHGMRLTKKFGLRQRHKIQFRLKPCSSESKCFRVSDFTWMCDASRKVDRTALHNATQKVDRTALHDASRKAAPLPVPTQQVSQIAKPIDMVGFTHSCILFWNWYHFLRVLMAHLTPILLKATLAWPVNSNKKVIANKNFW